MRFLIQNIRGWGAPRRRTQLKNIFKTDQVDIIGLQETIKQDFSAQELRWLEHGGQFNWNWVPATGHSGGLLLGFRDEFFEVGFWRKGSFFISADILQRNNNLKWRFMLVYGLADHSRTSEFLGELETEVANCLLPIVVAGDFNLVRRAEDKSNGAVNWPRVRRFNDVLASLALREICRAGARFTWTNNQAAPIRSVLDRVFVSPSWEVVFPLASLTAVTRIGSDHCPLILDNGEKGLVRSPRFFFQTWWFGVPGFGELVRGKIGSAVLAAGTQRSSIDLWQHITRGLRKFLKGWGANLGRERRLFREDLVNRIQELDAKTDADGLDEVGWALRYSLEDQIIASDSLEEE
jgi:exonuclease III